MPLFEFQSDQLAPVPRTTFSDRRVLERNDLQRLLRDQIEIVAPEVMVIAEEFGAFTDSRRRIDLLGLDREARPVVIELKRTEDGGHLELQALRYAAMISAMTLEQMVDAHESYLVGLGRDESAARSRVLEWIANSDDEVAGLSSDVRIVLVSADFGSEITTAVLWLNTFDRMDIRCVRLIPYLLREQLVIDVQQIVPLPEAADYQVRVKSKQAETRSIERTSDGRDWTRYSITTPTAVSGPLMKRRAVLYLVCALHDAGLAAATIAAALPSNRFVRVDGELEGEQLLAAMVEDAGISDTGWWFTGEGEPLVRSDQTWVLSKRWNRYSIDNALTSLVAIAPPGYAFEADAAGPTD